MIDIQRINLPRLIAGGIAPTQARAFVAPLLYACGRFGILTLLQQAAFVAQCAHESMMFTALEESLWYRDAGRLAKLFRTFDVDHDGAINAVELAAAAAYVGQPQKLANRIYAGRIGNGDEASGDGWRYRGRGLIQLTGRANYVEAGALCGRPYVEFPDLVLSAGDACLTAASYWTKHKLNAIADAHDIDGITRVINAGMVGRQERHDLFESMLVAFA